ncbi:hypothetical protein GGS23DRAFT_166622 [Durotheca rogersii]|uniref:uncharacterized protein n=1 Tax=Durotheca rogersii TaxID=419775 RepID=UPI00221F393F|nr:uncharacterized protein GGS23DRAFT_166622 [Durotheca rogersii]KAI5867226.1 hypothetical protein GGS23DRAFT_166622 [Durotheca rogersii]
MYLSISWVSYLCTLGTYRSRARQIQLLPYRPDCGLATVACPIKRKSAEKCIYVCIPTCRDRPYLSYLHASEIYYQQMSLRDLPTYRSLPYLPTFHHHVVPVCVVYPTDISLQPREYDQIRTRFDGFLCGRPFSFPLPSSPFTVSFQTSRVPRPVQGLSHAHTNRYYAPSIPTFVLDTHPAIACYPGSPLSNRSSSSSCSRTASHSLLDHSIQRDRVTCLVRSLTRPRLHLAS